jgi:phosphoribosylamine--glycine ligase
VKVLIVGSGGREHALLNAVQRSPLLSSVRVSPGNAGTSPHNLALDVSDHEAVVTYCQEVDIDLVIIGPEVPLVAGLADDLRANGLACFGPSAAAAQLEGSKSFTREFAARNDIPGPRSMAFTDPKLAIAWLDVVGDTAVVKADGLAGGKGVVVPSTLAETEAAINDMLSGGSTGQAGHSIVLEEQMVGPEVSLFGISDGHTVITLAAAQDHKRVGTGDAGPNTGGMGAFAPVPGLDESAIKDLSEQFLAATVRGMAAEGNPYEGVLYAGLMLTDTGPKLVEYNCRFGDPEAQVVLPLIDSDPLELLAAAANHNLADVELELSSDTLVNVVVAAEGYPTDVRKGVPIPDLPSADGLEILHAGTGRDESGQLVSTGGRVLNVVGRGSNLESALAIANAAADQIVGDGLFARPDIGWRHAGPYYQSDNKSQTTEPINEQ